MKASLEIAETPFDRAPIRFTPRLLGAGINQRYVVRIIVREEHAIEVDAASAQEAEVKAWAVFHRDEFLLEAPRRARTASIALKENDEEYLR